MSVSSSLEHRRNRYPSVDWDGVHFSAAYINETMSASEAFERSDSQITPPPTVAIPFDLSIKIGEEEGTIRIENLEDFKLDWDLMERLTPASRRELFLAICYQDDLLKLHGFNESRQMYFLMPKTIREGFLEAIKTDAVKIFKELHLVCPEFNIFEFCRKAQENDASSILQFMGSFFSF